MKKTLKPEIRKEIAEELAYERDYSISRACRTMNIYRSYFYYISKKNDAPVEKAIREAAEFGDGFDKIYQRLRKAGYTWNHKKVYRVYRKIHFNKRCRLKKRLPQRVLTILEDAISSNGKPDCIRTDNGPEFISDKLKIWCLANGVEHKFTQPGKPTQNSYIERFNGSYRRAILDAYIFRNLDEVREITERWRYDYNYNRPHEALGNMTPIEYKQKILNKNTNFDVNLLTV